MLIAFAAELTSRSPTDPAVLLRLGAYHAPRVWEGEPWRLLTALFLHAGVLHLGVNAFGLLVCGHVERLIGTRWWLATYFAAGVAGCATSGLVSADRIAVGASGAIYGILGVLFGAAFGRLDAHDRLRLPRAIWPLALVALLLDAVLGSAVLLLAYGEGLQPDLAGHAGGLAVGLWLAHVVLPPRQGGLLASLRRVELDPQHGLRVRLDRGKLRTLGLGLAALAALVGYSLRPVGLPAYRLEQLDAQACAGELDAALAGYQALATRARSEALDLRIAATLRHLGRPAEASQWVSVDAVAAGLGQDIPEYQLGRHYAAFAERAAIDQAVGGDGLRRRVLALLDQHPLELAPPAEWAARANNRAMILAVLGAHLDEAETLARSAVHSARTPLVLDTLAWVLARQGELPAACEALDEALRAERSAPLLLHRGRLLAALGEREAAARDLAAALERAFELSFAERLEACASLRRLRAP